MQYQSSCLGKSYISPYLPLVYSCHSGANSRKTNISFGNYAFPITISYEYFLEDTNIFWTHRNQELVRNKILPIWQDFLFMRFSTTWNPAKLVWFQITGRDMWIQPFIFVVCKYCMQLSSQSWQFKWVFGEWVTVSDRNFRSQWSQISRINKPVTGLYVSSRNYHLLLIWSQVQSRKVVYHQKPKQIKGCGYFFVLPGAKNEKPKLKLCTWWGKG